MCGAQAWFFSRTSKPSFGRLVFTPASHTLDDDDPNIFFRSAGVREEYTCCKACYTMFPAVYTVYPDDYICFAPFPAQPPLKPNDMSRYEWLERLMWGRKDTHEPTVSRAILVLNKRPWQTWKRRYWLRAAIYFENMRLIHALLKTGVPLEGQLSWARVHKHDDIVDLLAEWGADRDEAFEKFKDRDPPR